MRGETLTLSWATATHVGRKRDVNQDAVMGIFPIFSVADGMGGYAAGEIASAAVVGRLSALAEAGTAVGEPEIEAALRGAVEDLAAADDEIDAGTGTTVTGIVFTEAEGEAPWWNVFNIGDSRVYVLREGELEQVTTDHSVVQELIAIGAISPDEAETHPHGNVITRAVGFSEDPVPDYLFRPVEAGTRWVICSDGLTKELTDFGIQHFLERGAEPLSAANLMIEAAVENGGRDNVTVLVLDVIGGTADEPADSGDDVSEQGPAESSDQQPG